MKEKRFAPAGVSGFAPWATQQGGYVRATNLLYKTDAFTDILPKVYTDVFILVYNIKTFITKERLQLYLICHTFNQYVYK